MATTTHHFDWRALENKPDNAEILKELIDLSNSINDVYHQEIVINNSWNENFMTIFHERMLAKYGNDITPCLTFTSTITVEVEEKKKKGGGGGGKKGKKTPVVSVRDKVHRETERKMIEKDLDLIRIDPKTFRPTTTSFRNQPTFAFMIAEWNIVLWKKVALLRQASSISKGVLLDAIISMDRIYREEIQHHGDKIAVEIRNFFHHMNTTISPTLLPREDVYQELFYNHPELMVNPFSQKRTGRISLYREQIMVMEHVVTALMQNSPLLLGDRMPPGTGKSFLAVPLAQKMAALHTGKTLLFACSNQLVRTDIATISLLGKHLHLWMGRCDKSGSELEYLVRPYKTCFPVNWKKVYKTQDENKTGSVYQQIMFYKDKEATGRFPDILICDLETCAAILKDSRLQKQFVAYIDEFVSDPDANLIMSEIAQHLPRQSVLLSAILPRFHEMPSLIRHFLQAHDGTENNVVRIESNQLTISCTVVRPDGKVALPHHFIETADQIPILIQRIREDPLIGRMYAPQQVYQLISHIEDMLPPEFLFQSRFPSVSLVDHTKIRDYILDLLEYISTRPVIFEKMRSMQPQLMEPVDPEKIATTHSHFYQGRTLAITSSERLYPLLDTIRKDLLDKAPDIRAMMTMMEKRKMEITKKLEQMRNKKSSSGSSSGSGSGSGEQKSSGGDRKVDAIEHGSDISFLENELASLAVSPWPLSYVVNSLEHAARFRHTIRRPAIRPIIPEECETAFSDFLHPLLLSGIGVYDFSQCTEYQRRLVMRSIRQLSILFAGHEIVFGTNIEGLTNLLIDGCYGDHVSRNVLFQLIGRAGRVGQSYEALIAINSDVTLNKIMSFHDVVDEDAVFFENIFQPLIV